MVSKCANPGCPAPFLYLHQGKLFRMEAAVPGANGVPAGNDPQARRLARRIEYFWLCNECAKAMTLTFEKGVGVTIKPLVLALKAAS
jgi:hypothetical protein